MDNRKLSEFGERLQGDLRPAGTPLNSEIRHSVHELTWDDRWVSGPEREEKAKAKIGNFFEENPDEFWLYTAGYAMSKRKLILDRLGVQDEALRKRMLRGND